MPDDFAQLPTVDLKISLVFPFKFIQCHTDLKDWDFQILITGSSFQLL